MTSENKFVNSLYLVNFILTFKYVLIMLYIKIYIL